MSFDIETLERVASDPISDTEPTGSSAKYEPEYERLIEEFEKQQSMSGESTDWDSVVNDAIAILERHSKDLLVACYLWIGLFQTRGYQGLAEGLSLIHGLGRNFGAALFPQRERARVAALEMAGERLAKLIAALGPSSDDQAALIAAKSHFDTLAEALGEALGEAQVDLRDFRNAFTPLATHAQQAEQERAARGQEASPPHATPSTTPPTVTAPHMPSTPPPHAEPPAPAAPCTIGNAEDCIKAAVALGTGAGALAAFLRQQDPRNPFPYLLVRATAWNDLSTLPGDHQGVFGFPGPDKPELNGVRHLLRQGEYTQLIEELEGMAVHPVRRYWLDAHRHLTGALDGLGKSEAAIAAVKAGLAAVVRRFPRLLELRFSNGTPFADEQTRAWIQGEVLPGDAVGSAEGQRVDRSEPWLDAAAEAARLSAKGDFNEGAVLLSRGRNAATSCGERFRWELEQARYCQQAGRPDLSLPLLGHLEDEVEHFSLEAWEPQLAVEVARMLVSTESGTPPNNDPTAAARRERLRARLCRLDIGAAIEVIPKKP